MLPLCCGGVLPCMFCRRLLRHWVPTSAHPALPALCCSLPQRPRLGDQRASVQAAMVQAQYRRLAVPLLVRARCTIAAVPMLFFPDHSLPASVLLSHSASPSHRFPALTRPARRRARAPARRRWWSRSASSACRCARVLGLAVRPCALPHSWVVALPSARPTSHRRCLPIPLLSPSAAQERAHPAQDVGGLLRQDPQPAQERPVLRAWAADFAEGRRRPRLRGDAQCRSQACLGFPLAGSLSWPDCSVPAVN